MKKLAFAASFAVLAIAALAAPRGRAAAKVSEPEPPDGGMVLVNAEGKLAIVNACGAPSEAVAAAAKKIGNIFMIVAEPQTADGWSLAGAKDAFAATGGNAAVFIVKDSSLPISLVAPEACWGVVNAEGMSGEVLGKEIMRTATILLGAASSKYEASVMRPAFSLEDIDKLGELATIDSLMAIFPNLKTYGFKQYEMMTFREACENGCAPDPKTDEQRKIAEEFGGAK